MTGTDGLFRRFIVFEGIDGAGTTTQAARLRARLEERGERVVSTFEPSDGPVGTLVRNALRRRFVVPRGDEDPVAEVDPRVVALLFAADRIDHLDAVIRPALEKGFWVLSDRYVDSSLAYQSIYMDLEWVRVLNLHAPRPGRTFFLEVPPAVAIQRILAGRAAQDHFETLQRLERVHAGYRTLYREPPADLLCLDGTLPVDDLASRVVAALP
ncbi:MAG: dTMP kinase [Deltaproteobacteria bacterium]|nr:dTMP kinase [Deltaproteobacteria bacterium]